ncbi:MAG: S1 family peptidase [Bacteroidota bacterium]|nr:S1 family peptidase [Bacteroidota bacterium]
MSSAQKNSVVQVHADKVSGYGVAWGGPQNQPDLIVTALHVVSGKKNIMVVWQGKTAYAQIEKVYRPADLALLKLKTPLGIPPLQLYSGEPPWDTNINFWEVPVNTKAFTAKNTILEERTRLTNISPRVANNPTGLSKSLCMDNGQYYPSMSTEVINFKEPNIRKAHSGSPLTYGDKILGMVDGGAKLIDGKACVWAIPASDFTKLFTQGTPLTKPMQSCDSPDAANKYMFGGMRSDNPMLTPEELAQAQEFEVPISFEASNGNNLELYHDYRLPFEEIYLTLFEDEQVDMASIFEDEDELTLSNLLNEPIDIYIEELTGVSLMIPAACNLNVSSDEYGTLVETSSPGGLINMSFYISYNLTVEDGMAILEGFKEYMISKGQPMQADPDDIEDLTDDEFTPYYNEYIENAFEGPNGEIESEFSADLIMNDGDFLAITVESTDWNQLQNNPDELLFLYLIQTCSLLSDFLIY